MAVVLLVTGAVYETAVALELIAIGALGGEGPVGEGFVATTAFSGFLLGIGASVATALRSAVRPAIALTLLAPAGAAFMTALFYSFDPYYAPTLRRASEGGVISPAWVFVLVGASLVTAVLAAIRPRLGSVATFLVLLLCAVTTFAERLGH